MIGRKPTGLRPFPRLAAYAQQIGDHLRRHGRAQPRAAVRRRRSRRDRTPRARLRSQAAAVAADKAKCSSPARSRSPMAARDAFVSRESRLLRQIVARLRRREHLVRPDDQNRRMVRLSGCAGRRSRPACHRQNARACGVALGSPSLRECEDLGARRLSYLDEFVIRLNRRKTRHAAFRSLLAIGLAAKPITCKMLIMPKGKG